MYLEWAKDTSAKADWEEFMWSASYSRGLPARDLMDLKSDLLMCWRCG